VSLERLSAALADRYRLERELGQGGMATVYLAQDLKHDRQVAIKVLKPDLAAVLGAERFITEIKTTAALQHPHILPLFDSGDAGGFLFYVMPYIDGETIRDRLNRETQLGIDEAVRITREVADALDYAHRHGVVHRDIKPENILLHDGRPMVMDFGIALAVSAAAGGRMTETGLSLGTPHYMSPEQATAEKEITARSDIYSLGSVLYEMLTGNPPHSGGSAQQIIMKIVTEEPAPVTRMRKAVPPNVAAAVAKALEKLPADRFESAKAFAEALQNPGFAVAGSSSPAVSATASARYRRAIWGLSALAGLSMAIAAWGWLQPTNEEGAPPMHTQLSLGRGERFASSPSNSMRPSLTAFVFSPDGSTLVFVGDSGKLYVRQLDALIATPIPGIVGAQGPFFSPDGLSIGYSADGFLRRVALAGGPPTDIIAFDEPVWGASWSGDQIVFSQYFAGLMRVSATGAAPPDTLVAGSGTALPHFLPGGREILFTWSDDLRDMSSFRVEWLSLGTGERRILIEDAADARYVPTGHLIFARQGKVLGVAFDPARPEITTAPFTVVPDVMQALNGGNTAVITGAMQLAFSPRGQMAWLAGGIAPDAVTALSWLDRQGRRSPVEVGPIRQALGVRLSPDGRQAAIGYVGTRSGVKIIDLERGTSQDQRTPSHPHYPIWSPDGRRLLARSRVADTASLVWVESDLSRPPEPLVAGRTIVGRPSFLSPDGTELIGVFQGDSGPGLFAISLADGTARAIPTRAWGRWATLSPDGRWLAYVSNVGGGGAPALYVRPWPALDRLWKIAEAASSPAWTRNGRELVYTLNVAGGSDSSGVPRQRMMSVEVGEGPDPRPSAPRELFTANFNRTGPYRSYDVSADGSRFYVLNYSLPPSPPGELQVMSNWFAHLRRLASSQGNAP